MKYIEIWSNGDIFGSGYRRVFLLKDGYKYITLFDPFTCEKGKIPKSKWPLWHQAKGLKIAYVKDVTPSPEIPFILERSIKSLGKDERINLNNILDDVLDYVCNLENTA